MPKIVAPPKSEVTENRPIITTCPHCQYTISYTEEEVERVDNESMGVYCPKCAGVVKTEHIEPFTFPKTFFHFREDDFLKMSDTEIQKYIESAKSHFPSMKSGEYYPIMLGNVLIIAFKEEDDDGTEEKIIVAKDYYEDSVFH